MGKSKSKNRSEVEFLRGKIRQLESKLKYYERRAHIQSATLDEAIDEHEIVNVEVEPCSNCGKGALIQFDFYYATLSRCDHCGYEHRQGKK